MHVGLISGLFQVSDVQERMDKPVLTDTSKMETKMDTISGRNEVASNGESW
jgi:hypothetical protein